MQINKKVEFCSEIIDEVQVLYKQFRENENTPAIASARTLYELENEIQNNKALTVLAYFALSEQIVLDDQVEFSTRANIVKNSIRTLSNDREYVDEFAKFVGTDDKIKLLFYRMFFNIIKIFFPMETSTSTSAAATNVNEFIEMLSVQ